MRAARSRSDSGFRRKPGEVVVGALAGLREVKNLPALVRAVGGCPAQIRLVIVGEGPERAGDPRRRRATGDDRPLIMPGFLPDPHRYVGLFDIMALSSMSEQFPISVVEGMAAGLPIAAPAVGDMLHMVPSRTAAYHRTGNEVALARRDSGAGGKSRAARDRRRGQSRQGRWRSMTKRR